MFSFHLNSIFSKWECYVCQLSIEMHQIFPITSECVEFHCQFHTCTWALWYIWLTKYGIDFQSIFFFFRFRWKYDRIGSTARCALTFWWYVPCFFFSFFKYWYMFFEYENTTAVCMYIYFYLCVKWMFACICDSKNMLWFGNFILALFD